MKALHIAAGGLFFMGCLGHSACLAQSVCDSFGPGNSFDPINAHPVAGPQAPGPAAGHSAAVWIDDWCASGQLRTIEIALKTSGSPGSFTVSFHDGTATHIGSAYWSRTIVTDPQEPTIRIVLAPTPFIAIQQSYWLIITPADATSAAQWHLNDQEVTGTIALGEWDSAASGWGAWMITPNVATPALRISTMWCYVDCDTGGPPPWTNIDDLICFINEFAAALTLPHEEQIASYANCDGSTLAPVLNVDDFTCFLNAFAAGCP